MNTSIIVALTALSTVKNITFYLHLASVKFMS